MADIISDSQTTVCKHIVHAHNMLNYTPTDKSIKTILTIPLPIMVLINHMIS